jgi:hypothetical protein
MANVLHWTSHQQMAEQHRMTKSAAAWAGGGDTAARYPLPISKSIALPPINSICWLCVPTTPKAG